MKMQKTTREYIRESSALWKTTTCVTISTLYFALLVVYPYGLTKGGFVVERAIVTGVIFFAIAIPAWITTVKREFFSGDVETIKMPARHAVGKKDVDKGGSS